MKNKKNLVMIVMLVAVALMSMGYALFATQLNINSMGNITSQWNVYFESISSGTKVGGANNASTPSVSGTSANMNVNLDLPGDSMTYSLVLKNGGTVGAIIEDIDAVATGSGAIIYSISGLKIGDKLAAGASKTITVKIEYDPNTSSQPSETYKKLTVTIDAVQDIGQTITNQTPSVEQPMLLSTKILKDNIAYADNVASTYVTSSTGIDFRQSSSDTNGKGVYYTNDDDGTSYYFRGDVTNNYVKFGTYAKDTTFTTYDFSSWSGASKNVAKNTPMYWRIIRINGDGTIRLMYIGTEPYENGADLVPNVPASAFNYGNYSHDSLLKHYTYESGGSLLSSNVKTDIEDWYSNNLDSNSKTLVADSNFCNDTKIASKENDTITFAATKRLNSGTPTLKCGQSSDVHNVKNGKLSYPVALITADEVMMAGAGVEIQGNHYLAVPNHGYAWTMTPNTYTYEFKIWSIEGSNLDDYSCEYDFSCGSLPGGSYANPVINLKADVAVTGSGTINDPYVVQVN